MTLSALQTLIATGESQTLEFKATFDKACIATLVAFANPQGYTTAQLDPAKIQRFIPLVNQHARHDH